MMAARENSGPRKGTKSHLLSLVENPAMSDRLGKTVAQLKSVEAEYGHLTLNREDYPCADMRMRQLRIRHEQLRNYFEKHAREKYDSKRKYRFRKSH